MQNLATTRRVQAHLRGQRCGNGWYVVGITCAAYPNGMVGRGVLAVSVCGCASGIPSTARQESHTG